MHSYVVLTSLGFFQCISSYLLHSSCDAYPWLDRAVTSAFDLAADAEAALDDLNPFQRDLAGLLFGSEGNFGSVKSERDAVWNV